MRESAGIQALLSERTIIIVLLALLAFFWSVDLVDSVAALFVFVIIASLLLRLEFKKHRMALKLRATESKKLEFNKHGGIKSVRANTLNAVPLPILIIGEDHRISFSNQAANDLLGSDIINNDVYLYLRKSKIMKAIKSIFEGGKKHAGVVRYTNKQKRSFDVTISRVSGTGGDDVPTQAMAFFYEITSMLQTEQMRVDFVANASHELRTPLSSLIGFIETLQGPAKDDAPAQERFLGIMQSEAERMVRLIDDLLSLSKIEMSRHEVPETIVNVETMIQSVLLTASKVAKERNIEFSCEIEKKATKAIADPDQLMQVLLNLCINAAKYADRESTVHVEARLSKTRKFINVSIRDEGPGISKEHLARLTERFYRVDNARSRKMGGTGLGLAIVKHILLRHDSMLDVKSAVGKGTTFSFKLRRA